ncbi:hypothetical protein LIA77_07642 [Sarocladium implicatum]|nr:hypothetical protein LIA77_07642 [Sarocladium implicatum]
MRCDTTLRAYQSLDHPERTRIGHSTRHQTVRMTVSSLPGFCTYLIQSSLTEQAASSINQSLGRAASKQVRQGGEVQLAYACICMRLAPAGAYTRETSIASLSF